MPAALLALFGKHVPVIGSWTIALWVPFVFTLIEYPASVYQWATTKYCSGNDRFVIRRGLLFIESSELNWEELATFTIRTNSVEKCLGICRIILGTGVRDDESIELDGVDLSAAESMHRIWLSRRREHHGTSSIQYRERAVTDSDETVIQRLNKSSYIALIGSGGGFAVGLSAIAGGYSFIANLLAWPELASLSHISITTGAPRTIILLATLAVVGVAWGALQTIIRYYKFSSIKNNESISISGGIFASTNRVVKMDSVCGVEVFQNPVFLLLGWASLRLITIDRNGDVTSNVVSPVFRIENIESLINRTGKRFDQRITASLSAQGTAKVKTLAGVMVVLLSICLAFNLGNQIGVIGLAVSVLVIMVLKMAGSRIRVVSDGHVLTQRGLFWRKLDVFPVDAIVLAQRRALKLPLSTLRFTSIRVRASGKKSRIGFDGDSWRSVAKVWGSDNEKIGDLDDFPKNSGLTI